MELLENLDIRESVRWSGKLMFPIGGMFWVKTQAIRQLLDIPWRYEMFPEEEGQMDGSLQHSVERLIGELTLANGFAHLLYDSDEDQFLSSPNQ
jgi:lipopolysaccharide biosynthesis protein